MRLARQRRAIVAGDLVGGVGVGVVVDHHVCAFGRQPQGDGAADAARGAGHQRDLAVEALMPG